MTAVQVFPPSLEANPLLQTPQSDPLYSLQLSMAVIVVSHLDPVFNSVLHTEHVASANLVESIALLYSFLE